MKILVLFAALLFFQPLYSVGNGKLNTAGLSGIVNPIHQIDYKKINLDNVYSNAEISKILGIDTSAIVKGTETYIRSDEQFYSKPPKGLEFVIYYYQYYGAQLDKILLVKKNGKITGRKVLASAGETNATGKFLNDTAFVSYEARQRTISDQQNSSIILVDSVIETFSINNSFIFQLLEKERYLELRGYTPSPANDTIRFFSDSVFILNGIPCVWSYSILPLSAYNKAEKELQVKILKTELFNSETNKIIFSSEKYTGEAQINQLLVASTGFVDTQDYNFDGFSDISFYCRDCSGSGGAVSIVFLFSPEEGAYKESEMLSGFNLELDKNKKTVTTTYKSGKNNFEKKVVKFGDLGVEYTEYFITDRDKYEEQVWLSYKKLENGVTVEEKSKTIAAGGNVDAQIHDWLDGAK